MAGSNLSITGLAPYLIQVPAAGGGAAIAYGSTFKVRRFTGAEVVFEFNSVGGLSNANHAAIQYLASDSANEVAEKIRVALSVVNKPLNQLTAVEDRINQLVLNLPAWGWIVFLGGAPTHHVDTSNSSLTQEGTPAVLLQVPAGGGSTIIDGETLVFDNGIRRITLEFNQFGSIGNDRLEVPYSALDSADDIVAAIQQALPADLGITLSDLGNGVIHVRSVPSHTLDLSGSPTLASAPKRPLSVQTRDAGLATQITPFLQINISPLGKWDFRRPVVHAGRRHQSRGEV